MSKKTFYATLSCVKTPENQVTKKVKNANLLYAENFFINLDIVCASRKNVIALALLLIFSIKFMRSQPGTNGFGLEEQVIKSPTCSYHHSTVLEIQLSLIDKHLAVSETNTVKCMIKGNKRPNTCQK